MAIVYDPKALLKKIAPVEKIKRLLKGNITLKKTALNFIDATDFIDKKSVAKVALKTVKSYQERIKAAELEVQAEVDATKAEAIAAGAEIKSLIIDDPKLLIQRVQNEVIFQVHTLIKEKYAGEMAEWLPSDADEPRPEHQLNYGKTYVIGEGIDGIEPGDEYGCQCGVRILVKQTELELE